MADEKQNTICKNISHPFLKDSPSSCFSNLIVRSINYVILKPQKILCPTNPNPHPFQGFRSLNLSPDLIVNGISPKYRSDFEEITTHYLLAYKGISLKTSSHSGENCPLSSICHAQWLHISTSPHPCRCVEYEQGWRSKFPRWTHSFEFFTVKF